MMKITKIFFTLIIILFVLYACKGEWMKKWKIGDNYYFTYDSSWGYAYIIDTKNTIVINMEIIAWNYDSIFIIVKQKPFDDIDDSILLSHPNATYYEKMKLYEECQIFNYWIIDKRKEFEFYYDEKGKRRRNIDVVFGPLTYEEYWAKRKELDVPDSLKLKEVEQCISSPTPLQRMRQLLR